MDSAKRTVFKKGDFLAKGDFAKSVRSEGYGMDLAKPPDSGEGREGDLICHSGLEDAGKEKFTEGGIDWK